MAVKGDDLPCRLSPLVRKSHSSVNASCWLALGFAGDPCAGSSQSGSGHWRIIVTAQLSSNLTITTVHPLSRGGAPVLVVGDEARQVGDGACAFAPSDIVEVFGHTAPAAYWACFYGKTLSGAERQLVADYLRQWREGPQLDS